MPSRDKIRVSHSTVRESGVTIIGNHNKLYGNDNKVRGNWNEVVDGSGNRLVGSWNKGPSGNTVVRKKGRKRRKRRGSPDDYSHRSKRRRIEVLSTDERGSLVQITGDVDDGNIGNFMSFGSSFTFDSDGTFSVSGPTAVGIVNHFGRSLPVAKTAEFTGMEIPEAEEEPSADEDTPEAMLCKICIERVHNTLVVDCSHACMCVTCARRVLGEVKKKRRCPICRQDIVKGIRRIYS